MKRKNGVLYTLLITLFVYALLTWILPVTTFNGEFANQGMVRMGINDMISYPTYTFYNFIYIFVYLGLVCCLYGLLRKIPAYRNLVSKIVSFVKERDLFVTILTTLLLTIVITFNGFTYEIWGEGKLEVSISINDFKKMIEKPNEHQKPKNKGKHRLIKNKSDKSQPNKKD